MCYGKSSDQYWTFNVFYKKISVFLLFPPTKSQYPPFLKKINRLYILLVRFIQITDLHLKKRAPFSKAPFNKKNPDSWKAGIKMRRWLKSLMCRHHVTEQISSSKIVLFGNNAYLLSLIIGFRLLLPWTWTLWLSFRGVHIGLLRMIQFIKTQNFFF